MIGEILNYSCELLFMREINNILNNSMLFKKILNNVMLLCSYLVCFGNVKKKKNTIELILTYDIY